MTPIEYIIQTIAGNTLPPNSVSADIWDDVAITAIALGLAPLLHWHNEQNSADVHIDIPPMVKAKLSLTRQAHAKRNHAIAQQLAEILMMCNQCNIKVIVLKGALLAPLVYPEAGLRPMNDIDLLFQPQDLPQAEQLLQQLGYQGKYKSANQGPGVTKHLSTYRRSETNGSTPNPYLSPSADRTIEPHGSLEESWFGLKVDVTPGVWSRTIALTLTDQPASRLSTPDLLLHLCVHATFHVIMGVAVFVQLYDIGRVIMTCPDELNWAEFLALTRQANAQPFVYAALYWAVTLYQADIPTHVLELLKGDTPTGLETYIHTLDADGLFNRAQQSPLNTLSQRLKRGLTDRYETTRWATSLPDKWKVWQTALAFYKTDTAGLVMGKSLKTSV